MYFWSWPMHPVDYAALTERKCAVCKQVKPVSEFNKYDDPTAPLTGWRYYSRCIACNRAQCREYGAGSRDKRNERLRAWRKSNPEKAAAADRRKAMRQKYDLSVEEADALLASNGGLCWICDDKPSKCIDHDHETGKVRGALCANCNSFLGRVEANPKIMPGVADYLDRPCHADVLLDLANQEGV